MAITLPTDSTVPIWQQRVCNLLRDAPFYREHVLEALMLVHEKRRQYFAHSHRVNSAVQALRRNNLIERIDMGYDKHGQPVGIYEVIE